METPINMLKKVPDARQPWKIIYPLYEILTISVLAVICSANTSSRIAEFARIRYEWLKQFLPLAHAIAVHRFLISYIHVI